MRRWRRSGLRRPRWIREIRDTLGMTSRGSRRCMRQSQSAVTQLERSEITGRVQLDSLRKAGVALDCELSVHDRPAHDVGRHRQYTSRRTLASATSRQATSSEAASTTMRLGSSRAALGRSTTPTDQLPFLTHTSGSTGAVGRHGATRLGSGRRGVPGRPHHVSRRDSPAEVAVGFDFQ